jgi:hypothetical protein
MEFPPFQINQQNDLNLNPTHDCFHKIVQRIVPLLTVQTDGQQMGDIFARNQEQ